MKSLYETITCSRFTRHEIDESILDTDKGVSRKTVAEIFISKIRNVINVYTSGHRGADLQQSLEELWKEYDLVISGMKWYCTRYEGLKYGTEKGLCIPIVTIIKDDDEIYLSVKSRKGVDYEINSLNLPQWEKVAKQETKKMTDSFLKRYGNKIGKILNMQSEKEYNTFCAGFYTLK